MDRCNGDFLETVSGTHGLTGGADTILVIKRDRTKADAVLHATGRDIDEIEKALHFSGETGCWSIIGEAADHRRSEERNAIIRVLSKYGAMSPKEVAVALGGKDSGRVRYLLFAMKGDGTLICQPDGRYRVAGSYGVAAGAGDDE